MVTVPVCVLATNWGNPVNTIFTLASVVIWPQVSTSRTEISMLLVLSVMSWPCMIRVSTLLGVINTLCIWLNPGVGKVLESTLPLNAAVFTYR